MRTNRKCKIVQGFIPKTWIPFSVPRTENGCEQSNAIKKHQEFPFQTGSVRNRKFVKARCERTEHWKSCKDLYLKRASQFRFLEPKCMWAVARNQKASGIFLPNRFGSEPKIYPPTAIKNRTRKILLIWEAARWKLEQQVFAIRADCKEAPAFCWLIHGIHLTSWKK